MSWANSRGAPKQLPYDHNALRSARVDVRARIAWLLRISRMASPVGGTGADFCRRLGVIGIKMDQAGLTRREVGDAEVTAELISGYETLLFLPDGHLLGVCDALSRTLDSRRIRPTRIVARENLRAELDDVSTRVRDGSARGADWLRMAQLITQPGGVVLPTYLQDEWTYELVDQMSRSVGGAYVARVEALSRLMREQHTMASIVRVVTEQIAEPGAQATADAVSVWGDGIDPASLEAAVRVLLTTEDGPRIGAGHALLQRVINATMDRHGVETVFAALRTLAHQDPEYGGEVAFRVARRASPLLAREIAQIVGKDPLGPRPGSHIEEPAELRTYLAAATEESDLDGDQMLERLLREALSEDFEERRHHAHLVLMVSPYRRVLAATALRIAATTSSATARDAAGHMLSYLAGEEQRSGLLALLARPEQQLRSVALLGLAHGPGLPPEVDLRELMRTPGLAPTALYAAGISGHPDLMDVRTHGPATVRASVDWWVRRGPGIREPSRLPA
ncbi:hypothetical protein [Luteipulveratus flavus]|uniref:DUF4192 domain-containing protein n=1 Tax=Luteipulveratus flavus TaxID=3031728 RepID=A0ABT6C5M9_9MICO|nr:hypothetical protein [Luteipulveratus sp. YIM 133296]MDF8263863.1 hypothetical protein [Luteipulveratus sp. YIM 133296]